MFVTDSLNDFIALKMGCPYPVSLPLIMPARAKGKAPGMTTLCWPKTLSFLSYDTSWALPMANACSQHCQVNLLSKRVEISRFSQGKLWLNANMSQLFPLLESDKDHFLRLKTVDNTECGPISELENKVFFYKGDTLYFNCNRVTIKVLKGMIRVKKDRPKRDRRLTFGLEFKNRFGNIKEKNLLRSSTFNKEDLNKKFAEFNVQLLDYFDTGDIFTKLCNLAPILRRRWDEEEAKEEAAAADRRRDDLPPKHDDQSAG
jgi:hypothetical protein